ncbi:MAG: DUF4136 domain-containing protein [Ignavibacteria bacterium]|nr:MAG: DUF4136 domain-containing protein [Ignavibacteria bacterium]
MNLFKILIFSVFALLLIGCSSTKYTTDFDPTQDFGIFKTYRLANPNEVDPDDYLTQHPLTKKRVIAAINKDLIAKGFQIAEKGDPDFVVLTSAGTKERMQVTNTGGYGYGGWYGGYGGYGGGYGGSTYVTYYEEGALVIDIIDWQDKELSFRGVASGTISKTEKSPDEAQEDIDEIVKNILSKFPPGQGNK